VVSNDFTHYGAKHKYVPFTTDIMRNLSKLDGRAYSYISHLDVPGFLDFKKRTKDTICGYLPCAVLMSMLPEDSKCTLLDYYTCQDSLHTLDEHGFSVSYMAIAFSGSSWSSRSMDKSPGIHQEHNP
jgi:AmmeMemoRadiSam system protein B